LQQSLDKVKSPDPDKIADQNPDAAALATLRDKLASVVAQVTAAGVDRDRAAKLVDTAADASKLAASATAMRHYTADAAKARAAFGPALTAYADGRDALLATQAKG
jgi:hypothetical protein